MSLSLYQASVPQFVRMFGNLSAILDKAAAHAEARKIDPAVLLDARLAPDMHPLTRQVQIASDAAKGCAARLAGVEVPSFADTESSFAELQARIGRTLEFIGSLTPEQIDSGEGREIVLKVPGSELRFSGPDYLLHFVLPNFYFHVTTAYAILRHNGLEIGKMDYLGRA
ncbi:MULTISPECIES: DUF1993 domain-containing protein [unclassified Pseudomonas]|uniref:DUF1993 domain-containing protein n=1 Tax=unclassified Pseudomonas TaxID=196821 RepID=UPI00244B90F1|nr:MULTISPECIES: DUF1993 domain-containing protein [unclassified Pseudomonas]MDH0896747.1 DUF1993 domain-containing protein [Pseudomonas sp. GD03875]MDH1065924.1 DUF1993 domain-containing protein [Pseudomonas sp. GD03985]